MIAAISEANATKHIRLNKLKFGESDLLIKIHLYA